MIVKFGVTSYSKKHFMPIALHSGLYELAVMIEKYGVASYSNKHFYADHIANWLM
jgi:hypothetical protein